MYKRPSGYNPDQLKYMKDFAIGKINTEVFLKHRFRGTLKWYETSDLVKDPYLFYMFMNRIPYNYRPRALKEIHDLNNKLIRRMVHKDSGQVDEILAGNYHIDSTSFYLYEIAIILDTPIDYFLLDNPMYQNADPNTFIEYKKVNNIISFQEVVNETITRPIERSIKGYLIQEPTSFWTQKNIVRVDKRVEFFCLEIFLPSISYLNDILIQDTLRLFSDHVRYILYSKALLRDVPKISLIGLYDNNVIHASHLENMLPELMARKNAYQIYPV